MKNPKPYPNLLLWKCWTLLVIWNKKKLKVSPFEKTNIEQGFGCAGYAGETKSLNDMEQAIADDIRQQWRKE